MSGHGAAPTPVRPDKLVLLPHVEPFFLFSLIFIRFSLVSAADGKRAQV